MKSWEAVAEVLPSFTGKSKLTTWIAGIVKRKCVDYLRKTNPEDPTDPAKIEQLEEVFSTRRVFRGERPPGPHLQAAAREAREHIARALGTLPSLQRTVFGLWMEGFTYETIAAVAGSADAGSMDANHVGVLLVRAKASVRKSLREAGIRAAEDLL